MYAHHHYGYQEPHYSGSPYYPPPQHQPLPPPLPPQYHPEITFKSDYAARLAELTANSRPIIQSLTVIAQDYTQYADIVAECIEAHIRRVPPWMKLPAFYLLDAISKNVYVPYAHHFSLFVVPLYLETYDQVDQSTRAKMEEMLLTWRTGAPTGAELFGTIPQRDIEHGVWGAGTRRDNGSGFYAGGGTIQRAQVITELEFTLGQKERFLQSNPYDSVAKHHVNVLHQLRKMVLEGVSQEELGQILSQLRTLSSQAIHAPAPAPVSPPKPPPLTAYGPHAYPRDTNVYRFPLPPKPVAAIEATQPTDLSGMLNKAAAVSNKTPDISSLYANLLKAGLVMPTSASGTPPPADTKPAVNHTREAARSHRRFILRKNIKLTSAGLNKNSPEITTYLFDALPVQCKQCALRFTGDAKGKQELEDHMDMHFRQNRKASQTLGRGHSRSWYVSLDDWVNEVTSSTGKGKAKAKNDEAEKEKRAAELRAKFVVVPPGDEAKAVACPICKELLRSEFLEDDEEWVWKNAVMKEDKIYHATCHDEAVASTNSLAARFRSELNTTANGRSRSGTPDVKSPSLLAVQLPASPLPKSTADPADILVSSNRRSSEECDESAVIAAIAINSGDAIAEDSAVTDNITSAQLAGMKRKIDSDETSIKSDHDGEGTPLNKKVAMEGPSCADEQTDDKSSSVD